MLELQVNIKSNHVSVRHEKANKILFLQSFIIHFQQHIGFKNWLLTKYIKVQVSFVRRDQLNYIMWTHFKFLNTSKEIHWKEI